ncbi:MAG UNVERIFIED_CONTAM: hypothetical protein LVR18_43155 [Planctomycetaceae bacterium]
MLWTSRLSLLIRGSARSRLDVQIPDGYLPLDVSAEGLLDWYVVEPAAGSGAARLLSLQLSDARTGGLTVLLQGQQPRRCGPGSRCAAATCTDWRDECRVRAGCMAGRCR